MKKLKSIIVICAIDSQLETTIKVAEQVEKICDVGIATYGNKFCEPSIILEKLAKDKGYKFFDSPRQEFIPVDREFHCCEMIAYIGISKHFYKEYEHVYIAHHDITIKENPLPNYEKEMIGNWSFVAPLVKIGGEERKLLSLKEIETLGGYEIEESRSRLSHELLIFNKVFVDYLYNNYKTDEDLWEFFKKYILFSDLSMFDFYPEWNGFKAKVIDSCVIHGGDNLHYDVVDGILKKI